VTLRRVNQIGSKSFPAIMNTSNTRRDLAAWREAKRLVQVVYRETSGFPREEMFGLAAQGRRCAITIPSNMAEGAAGNSTGELLQHLGITCGSLAELETQLELAVELGFLKPDASAIELTNRVGMLVRLLRKSLRKTSI
jgi:four helix bundle protein